MDNEIPPKIIESLKHCPNWLLVGCGEDNNETILSIRGDSLTLIGLVEAAKAMIIRDRFNYMKETFRGKGLNNPIKYMKSNKITLSNGKWCEGCGQATPNKNGYCADCNLKRAIEESNKRMAYLGEGRK